MIWEFWNIAEIPICTFLPALGMASSPAYRPQQFS